MNYYTMDNTTIQDGRYSRTVVVGIDESDDSLNNFIAWLMSLSIQELQVLCEQKKLSSNGSKRELCDRLILNCQKGGK